LSDEYIRVSAGEEYEGRALAISVNRAMAGSEDIHHVLGDRIDGKTIIIADGSKGYDVLEEAGKYAVLRLPSEYQQIYFIGSIFAIK